MNKINEKALYSRQICIDKLNVLEGEVQEFVPIDNNESTGVVALDIKWKSGIHFIIYQTLWSEYYYVKKNCEQISNTFQIVGDFKSDTFKYIQGLINDINIGKYDNKLTPKQHYLKYVQQKGLTGYMNNTKWDKLFGIIRDIEKETGKHISIMYKSILETENPIYYWTICSDEDLQKDMYKYIEWLKIKPIVREVKSRGRLIETEYTYYDYTSIFLEKMKAANLRYEYLQQEESYIVYGYK